MIKNSLVTHQGNKEIISERIVVANTARFVPVTLVRDTIDGVWVTGLPAQADVIVIGQEYVRHGVRVAPTYQGEM